MYFSGYYVAGALGAYVPGLAWEQWHWTGVWAMAIAAYALGLAAAYLVMVRLARRAGEDDEILGNGMIIVAIAALIGEAETLIAPARDEYLTTCVAGVRATLAACGV